VFSPVNTTNNIVYKKRFIVTGNLPSVLDTLKLDIYARLNNPIDMTKHKIQTRL